MFGRMMNSFYYGKSGKGDFKKEDLPENRWQLFWEMLRVRISGLCRLNLMTVLAWLPTIIVIARLFLSIISITVVSGAYTEYLATGVISEGISETQIAALQEAGVNDAVSMSAYTSEFLMVTVSQTLLYLIPCILITGPIQAGVAHITRNWARDEHAFIWSDFKDAVKENWKQGLGVSAITSVLPLLIYTGYQTYGQMGVNNKFFILPQMLVITLGLVWALALTFMYPMMVCYDVKFGALIKNSIMMAIGRLPQTAVMRLATLLPSLVCLVIFYFTSSIYALLAWGAYYIILGFTFARFVFASYTNGVFDRFINAHMEGVEINRGLADPEDDDDEEDEGNVNLPDDSVTPPTAE
ncbi:MAG: DUF624 domain-containing protein [Clostridia bacterium]|nr:DUF624 domain-containing protein [Clostridiales bacterium]MBQ2977842.1 DUF624 domain-containing protein [Clostridia bacterium]